VLAAGALTGLAVFAPEAWWLHGASAALPLVYVAALTLPYLGAYRATHRLVAALGPSGGMGTAAPSAPVPAAELRPRSYGDYVPWAWEVLPLVIIGATAAYLAATYPAAPARIPTHFDLSGAPGWWRGAWRSALRRRPSHRILSSHWARRSIFRCSSWWSFWWASPR
jgi:hypothetical protein